MLALFALIGLLASLQGIMFAYGRNMYSLSRAGYYPKFLSLTGKRQTPWVALVAGAVIGFAALVVLDVLASLDAEGAGAVAGAIVLNIAVWGAVLAYLLQMVAFVILRRKYPNAKRPYRSPWGVPGAITAAGISALIFLGFLLNPTFVPAIIAIAVVYAVMLIAFAVYGRHHLVLSPEEEYAVSGGCTATRRRRATAARSRRRSSPPTASTTADQGRTSHQLTRWGSGARASQAAGRGGVPPPSSCADGRGIRSARRNRRIAGRSARIRRRAADSAEAPRVGSSVEARRSRATPEAMEPQCR